ncbi:MAG: hypothetical protein WKF57_14665 [Nakamurella sp.]
MTDDPRKHPADGEDRDPLPQAHPADDVTPAEARRLEALFGDLVAEEPPTTVTPLTVLSAARRGARSPRRSGGPPAGRTARRLRIGILAAVLVAVAGTGTVLLIRADPGGTAAAARTSVGAGTTAAAPSSGVVGSSGGPGSSGAPGSSVAGTTTAGSMSESGSMAPPLASSDASTGASSAASSSAAGSGSSTAGPVTGRCTLTAADLPRVRATVQGTVLQDARISLCRDPATIPSNSGSLLVNIRTSSTTSCADARPACRPVAGQSDAYTSSSPEGFWIWVYGRGHEVAVFRDTRPSGGEIDATVAAARAVLIAVS